MEITNIEKLKKIAQGEIIELPGFTHDEPFIARLKRPSLLNLVGYGQIPNDLLNAVHIVFFGAKTSKDVVSMKELNSIYELVAKAAMVEPSYDELSKIGLKLTDEQLMDIFNYTQRGVEALKSFRAKQQRSESNQSK